MAEVDMCYDIDGVVLIGDPGLAHYMTGISGFNVLKLQSHDSKYSLRSCSRAVRQEFSGFQIVHIGYVMGFHYGLLTNMSREAFSQSWIDFLKEAPIEIVGVKNSAMAMTLRTNIVPEKVNVVVDITLVRNFCVYVRNSRNQEVLAILTGMGLQQDPELFFSTLPRFIDATKVQHSYVHWSSDVSCEGSHLFLSSSRLDANWRGNGVTVFNPLGTTNYCTALFDESSKLVNNFKMETLKIVGIRTYHPELCHTRSTEMRRSEVRGKIAAAFLVGLGRCRIGPYKELCETSVQLFTSLRSALNIAENSYLKLRIEVILSEWLKLETDEMHQIFRRADPFRFVIHNLVVNETLPFCPTDRIQKVVDKNLIENPYFLNLPQVLCLEAYLTYLIDGGTLRVCYDALKLAIGGTLGETRKKWSDTEAQFPCIQPQNLEDLKLDKFSLEKLADTLNYHLKMSRELVIALLNQINKLLEFKKGDCPNPDDRFNNFYREAGFVCSLIRVLEEVQLKKPAQVTSDSFWSIDYHRRRNQLWGAVTPEMLARCLLHVPDRRGVRAFESAMLHALCEKYCPDDSSAAREQFLATRISQIFPVFPHSQPISAKNRRDRFWLVGTDTFDNNINRIREMFRQNCPISFQRVPGIYSFRFDCEDDLNLWTLLTEFLRKSPTRHPGLRPDIFRLIALIVLFCRKQQLWRKAKFGQVDRRTPYLDWSELLEVIGPKVHEYFNFFVAWGLLDTTTGTDRRETILGTYVVAQPPVGASYADAMQYVLLNKKYITEPVFVGPTSNLETPDAIEEVHELTSPPPIPQDQFFDCLMPQNERFSQPPLDRQEITNILDRLSVDDNTVQVEFADVEVTEEDDDVFVEFEKIKESFKRPASSTSSLDPKPKKSCLSKPNTDHPSGARPKKTVRFLLPSNSQQETTLTVHVDVEPATGGSPPIPSNLPSSRPRRVRSDMQQLINQNQLASADDIMSAPDSPPAVPARK